MDLLYMHVCAHALEFSFILGRAFPVFGRSLLPPPVRPSLCRRLNQHFMGANGRAVGRAKQSPSEADFITIIHKYIITCIQRACACCAGACKVALMLLLLLWRVTSTRIKEEAEVDRPETVIPIQSRRTYRFLLPISLRHGSFYVFRRPSFT